LMILDEHTKENLASGRYADQRRSFFGPLDRASAPAASRPAQARPQPPVKRPPPAKPRATGTAQAVRSVGRRPWSRSQQKLALLYNEQGLRPTEIAQKLGLSTYTVTQIILAARNRGKA
jgi:DNA-directed RNA polymerase specialized sigma24 family protein